LKAPTRALIVEDIEPWVYTLDRAARRAGASEVVVCTTLQSVRDALRSARFDVAILDVGLDPDDDLNSDGIKALEAIREVDGRDTRCVLVTGWQGGDRMDLQARATQEHGVDWAYMKENYEARAVIAKLTELLEQAAERRLSRAKPMADLCGSLEPRRFENQLFEALSSDARTTYSVLSRLASYAIPAVAMHPSMPMQTGSGGVCVGLYWSRALAAAVAVGLAPAAAWQGDGESAIPADLARVLPDGVVPELIQSARGRKVQGWLWELPGLDRDKFAG
jgi:CheY-like chemotaxis protein